MKGSVVAVHAETLKKLIADGTVPLEELSERLDPAEVAQLCGWIHPGEWYDIDLYARLLGVLRDFDGGGDVDYLVRAGRRSADNMIRSGLYPQFEYLRRTELVGETDPHARFVAFGRDLRQLCTVNKLLLNFAPNHVIVDPDHPDRYVIEHRDAAAYPEVLCWTSQGFCNRMAEEHDTPDLWSWERPRPDIVWYRMNRAV
jgi:hypothetical protein